MSNTEFKFDLFELIRIGVKWKKQILWFSFLMSLAVAIFFLFKKNYYKAYGSFYPASAVTSARVNLFKEENPEWIDIFGEENEVDHAYVVGMSENCVGYLIRKFNIAQHYGIDTNTPNAPLKTYKRFLKNFSITRSGFKHLEVCFIDEDQELAGRVVNESMLRIESLLRDLYGNSSKQVAQAIDIQIDSIQKDLVVYTDSLSRMRVRYGIYDIVSPGRKNLIISGAKGSGTLYAEGIERVQNLEEIKDRMVMDVGKYTTLSNQFKTLTFRGFAILHIIQWASPFSPKEGPYRILGVLLTGIGSFLFALFLALAIESYRKLKLKLQE
jgi:hypothetical protein